jgi:ubiquitin C-terminal hydrolase
MHGVGLINRDGRRECLNICYMNAIIQCLGNAPPFVQWLLNNNYHLTCKSSSQ